MYPLVTSEDLHRSKHFNGSQYKWRDSVQASSLTTANMLTGASKAQIPRIGLDNFAWDSPSKKSNSS